MRFAWARLPSRTRAEAKYRRSGSSMNGDDFTVSRVHFWKMSLLPFHKTILECIHDPSTNDLLILARGLGLRRIVCTLLNIYYSPSSLVLLLNTAPDEDSAIGAELGIMGCRNPGLRLAGYEMGRRERCVDSCW